MEETRGEDALGWIAVDAGVIACVVSEAQVRPKAGCSIVDAAAITGVQAGELRVIEDVEGFCAELCGHFLMNRKMFEDAHIKVRGARTMQRVAARVPKGQTGRSIVGSGIKEERSIIVCLCFRTSDLGPANAGVQRPCKNQCLRRSLRRHCHQSSHSERSEDRRFGFR